MNTLQAPVPALRCAPNGVNGASGRYIEAALAPEQLSALALGLPAHPAACGARHKLAQAEPHLAPGYGIDAEQLAQAGWGVLFHSAAEPGIHAALAPLLNWRQAQANQHKPCYREYRASRGYRPGMSCDDFLIENDSAPGQAPNPLRLPYYVLLVGTPHQIPFSFQHQLGVQYAVGRIAFDTLEQ
ncbi:hypothetical protein [Janthinobacterium agaricidamnosum]|uniref:Uncharacterized domain protein n=1 Tax=Janthinobacterium agaricidamnosum NBRC 102515 = DSM 9628 TaxID=1349767 RepID=W0V6B5_9BURK|nr:hypothetical protein [Janthinobacterium agaricidamnosum]CDG82812.1 putative uncharacterized domain protein [Janthinobacterium agaricidamnosum NBRC 102515 = DSM 9628]